MNYQICKALFNQVKNDLENAKNNLREIEEKEAGMMNFSREVESSRKLYETFLQRMKETNEVKELQSSNVRIIQILVSLLPISPSIYIYILFIIVH